MALALVLAAPLVALAVRPTMISDAPGNVRLGGPVSPPELTGYSPAANAVDVAADAKVMLTYSVPIRATTVTSQTVALHSMLQGQSTAAPSLDGNVVTVTPSRAFFPGELVYATATTGVANITGTHPLTGTVWQFNAGVTEGWGDLSRSKNFGPSAGDTNALAAGDYDGDGDLDLAVGSWDGQNVLYLNNGDGTFGAGVNFGTGNERTRALAWADMDGDGDLDLAVGNDGEQNVVYLNNGDGTLGAGVNFGPSNDATHALAWGDYDGDGDLDLAVGNYYGQNMVYVNNGDGTLGAGVNFGPGSDKTIALAWGDYDGDGDLDLAVGNFQQQNVLYPNNGDGTFGLGVPFGTGSGWTYALAWGDYDGDGDLDLAVGNQNEQNVLYPNNGDGTLGAAVDLDTANHVTHALAWGDYDGDGDLDLAVGNLYGQNMVYPNNGDGTFGAAVNFGTGSDYTVSLAWGDYDGDGDLDLAVGNYGEQDVVYLNQPPYAIVVSKTALSAQVHAGNTAHYRIVVTNTGYGLPDVQLVDTLPVGMMYSSATPAGLWNDRARTTTWDLGALSADEVITVNLRVHTFTSVVPGTVKTNTVRAWSDVGLVEDTDTAAITILERQAPPALVIRGMVSSGGVSGAALRAAGAPLAGATVTATLCLPGVWVDVTDDDGAYEIIIPGDVAEACETVTLVVTAPDHEPFTGMYLVADLRNGPVPDMVLLRLCKVFVAALFSAAP
jgi:uncharacterized repeat protein (TIGR01451 family)